MPETEAAAEYVQIDTLVPWTKNPRNNDAAAKEVARSIKRFGFGAPLLARTADRMVIAGHTRLKAAKLLGLDVVPVRFLDLSPTDAQLLALADNKVGEAAEWDLPGLSKILRGLGAEVSLDGLGFSSVDLEDLLREEILLPSGSALEDPTEAILEVFIQVRAPVAVSSQTIERVQAAVADLRQYGVEVSIS